LSCTRRCSPEEPRSARAPKDWLTPVPRAMPEGLAPVPRAMPEGLAPVPRTMPDSSPRRWRRPDLGEGDELEPRERVAGDGGI
jgi:hypothetical protein